LAFRESGGFKDLVVCYTVYESAANERACFDYDIAEVATDEFNIGEIAILNAGVWELALLQSSLQEASRSEAGHPKPAPKEFRIPDNAVFEVAAREIDRFAAETFEERIDDIAFSGCRAISHFTGQFDVANFPRKDSAWILSAEDFEPNAVLRSPGREIVSSITLTGAPQGQ
jgi:hypothetical protein